MPGGNDYAVQSQRGLGASLQERAVGSVQAPSIAGKGQGTCRSAQHPRTQEEEVKHLTKKEEQPMKKHRVRPLKRVVIREELIALTGCLEEAILLGQMLYWSERTRDIDKYIQEELSRQIGIDVPLLRGWIYKSARELLDETMLLCSEEKVRKHMANLVKNGWLMRRKNPYNSLDHTYQYRVNLIKVIRDLVAIGYYLEGYHLLDQIQLAQNVRIAEDDEEVLDEIYSHEANESEVCKPQEESLRATGQEVRTLDSVGTIPEITNNTEITSEISPLPGDKNPQEEPLRGPLPLNDVKKRHSRDVDHRSRQNLDSDESPREENSSSENPSPGEKLSPRKRKVRRDPLFTALAKTCGMDTNLLTQKQRGALNQTLKRLREAGITVEDLEAFARWWYKEDWRGKRGSPPLPHQVRECWGQFTARRAATAPQRAEVISLRSDAPSVIRLGR
jgi:hypothetical protein